MSSDSLSSSERWYYERKAAQAAESAEQQARQLTAPGREATPLQQALAVGSVIGWPISNSFEELNHDTGWNHVGMHAVGKQWAQASMAVYDNLEQEVVTKSHAQDGQAEQRKAIQNHPAIKLLKNPNPVMSGFAFRYLVGKHVRSTGGFVIWEILNEEGKPAHLWVLPRPWLQYMPPREYYPMGLFRVFNQRGMQQYWGNSKLAAGFYVDVRSCITGGYPHNLYPGEPWGALSACAKIIDISEQTDTAVWSSLKEAPRPGMTILMNGEIMPSEDEMKRLRADIQASKGGALNTGQIMMLWGGKNGAKIDRMGTSLNDLQSVEIREQNKKYGLGIQGVPDMVTGMRSDTGSYAGDAATGNAFVELGVQPDMDMLASVLNMRWTRYYGDGFELEFSAKRFDDPTLDLQKADKLFAGIDKQAATVNEWRAVLKLPPVPGGDVMKEPPPPVPGMPGAVGQPGQDGDLPSDTGDDLPDDESSGFALPDSLGGQTGSRLPSWLLNGSAKNGVAH